MPTQKIKVHFIGIGGIGISALAQYYLAQGLQVSGSDLVSSEITKSLEKMGIKISIGKNVFKKDSPEKLFKLTICEKIVYNVKKERMAYISPSCFGGNAL